MDGQEYLNQISAENRPIEKKGSKSFSSRLLLIGVASLILLVIIIIMGSMLKANKGSEKTLSYSLLLHINNTADIVHTYQPEIKSSNLRSNSASLYGVLTNTSRSLTDYMTEKYDYNEKKIDENLAEEATLNKDGLESDLFEAKINGTLDRIFAHKMAYEISILTSEEAKILGTTGDSKLKEVLTTSQNGLDVLYEKFNSFSEAK